MSVVNSDIEKIEKIKALLADATNQRQKKMYQSLLDKARKEIAHQESVPSEEDKRAGNLSSRSAAPKSDKSVEDNRQQKKHNKHKAKQLSSSTDIMKVETAPADSGDLSPDTKKPARPKDEKQSDSHPEPNIFQAVGNIKCTAQIKEDKLFITIGDGEYELKKGVKWTHKYFDKLIEEIEQNGSRFVWLRVYPNIMHDCENQEIRYWFTLVKANLERLDGVCEEFGFVFRGIWQHVKNCRLPVISVYRNIERLKYYQKLSFKGKKAFARPQNFPVSWDAPVEPFQNNRSLNQEEQMSRYFVQVRAVFEDGRFRVVEMISEPTLNIPKRIKPPKNKTKGQSEKKTGS